MADLNQYTIPLGIDPKGFLTGLDEIEAGLIGITGQAKTMSVGVGEAMTAAGKPTDALVQKMDAVTGSAKKMSDAAKAAGVDLNKTFSGDNLKTDGLKQKVSQFIATLKDATGKSLDFKFNVDQASVSTLVTKIGQAKTEISAFNIVLDSAKARLAGLTVGTDAFNELNDQIVTAETFLKNLAATTDDTEVPFVSLRAQLKQMKFDLQTMEEAGKGGTAAFIELSKRAGNVADQIADTSARVKNLASDTKGLDAGVTAIRGLAGAFAVGQGALALFGDQSEEVAKTIAKVQGAMALLQGVQEVANVLNKDSALSVYLQTFASKAHTEAVIAETAAVEGVAVATETATEATYAWTAALLLNPITLIVAVLATAAYALYSYAAAQKTAGLSAEQFNKFLEVQQGLLDEDLKIISRRTAIAEASANNEKLNQSALQQIRLTALKEQKIANQVEFDELSSSITKLNTQDKDYEKTKGDLNKRLEDLETKRKDLFSQIGAEEINLIKQQNDEKIKLQADFLKERQVEAGVEIEIAKQAQAYLNQIQQAKIGELREGQQKELATLNQGLVEKIQALNQEQAAKLKALTDQKAIFQAERALADENGKKVIDLQIAGLTKQIALTTENGNVIKKLEVELTNQTEFEKQQVKKKYAEQNADIDFQVANTLLSIQKESAKQKEEILTLTAQHEIDLIERTNQDIAEKNIQSAAIEKKLAKDIADSNLEFALKQVEIEKQINNDKLKNLKVYFSNTRDAQAAFHLLEAKIELEAAQKAVLALEAADKQLTDQEVKDADARVKAAQKAVKDATKDAKPQNIYELLFPGKDADSAKGQYDAKLFMDTLAAVGKAIDSFYALQIAAEQRLIDAQKKKVTADDDALSSLKDQLKTEQALRDKGYANNVDGVNKLIAEKNRQRDEDVRKQDEYQKKLAKIQKAQITAQTALQAAQLLTSATNILIQSTSEGGAVGAVLGGIVVAAMIAGFIAEKKAAYDAVNATNSFEHGGVISGKRHTEGGQKYRSIDGSGKVMELEDGEHVTNRNSTQKYMPLLDAINHDKLKQMDDRALTSMLRSLGIHFQTDETHTEALRESREHTSHQIHQVNMIGKQETPEEMKRIDSNLQMMANKQVVVVYEENGYIVTKTGNTIRKTRKHN